MEHLVSTGDRQRQTRRPMGGQLLCHETVNRTNIERRFRRTVRDAEHETDQHHYLARKSSLDRRTTFLASEAVRSITHRSCRPSRR